MFGNGSVAGRAMQSRSIGASEGRLASYRFYFMTVDDHIARGQDVECADDADAIVRANALHHTYAVEVWRERRKVARIEPSLNEV
jgi:hypothetical protein